jgi:hypothetical protein
MKKFVLVLLLALAGCGGGGGSEIVTPVTPTVNLECNVAPRLYGEVTSPTAYKGDFAIPTSNLKLNNSIIRSMDLKDLDPWWSRPSTNKCANKELYLQNVFIEHLNRMQKLGVEQIWVYNYGVWDDFSKPVWSIAESDYIIPTNTLKVIVQEAQKRNIKVFMNWQMHNSDKVSAWNSLDPDATWSYDKLSKENLLKIMDSYRILIASHAKFAQSIGISGMAVDLGVFNPPVLQSNREFREIYVTKMVNIIDDIRAVFKGTLVYGQYDSIIDERIISKIDRVRVMLWLGGQTPMHQLSVDSFKKDTTKYIEWFYLKYSLALNGKYQNLPVEWLIYAQGTQEFYSSNGYLEDSFCLNPCVQHQLKTDFSIQAIAIEGALQAISAQPFFTSGAVSISNYWHTDDLTPTIINGNTTFPNISSSIRNKPAEAIVKMWYTKS